VGRVIEAKRQDSMATPAEPPIARPFTRLALALLPPLVALVLQQLLWTLIQPYVWFLFYPAIFFSSWIGGLRAGLTATLASTALVWWFFVPPQHTLVKAPTQIIPALVFFAMGVLFGVLNDRLRRANQRASEALATSRAANEEISHLYEKTRELDELKMNFFANVSHELRTPLTLILGPAERMIASPDTAAAARSDLEVIVRNARTLLRHVNDLLDVSKLEAGKMTAAYADVDLARLARFVAGHFEVLSGEKRIAFRVEAPEALPAQVDPGKVQRVLLNLLSNSFKFTPAGGSVRLTLRGTPGRVSFEVADSGPGIAPDKREAVFERFRQLEGGATRRFGGTGLGLSIARELVLLQQGSIMIREAPEGGALFVVELPRSAPAEAPVRSEEEPARSADDRQFVDELRDRPPPATSAPSRSDGALALVVEDNPEMNRFIAESLSARYRVVSARDGKEGLARAIELAPDVIVTDVMMPEMSGDEMLRAIRARPEFARTPVVVVSARADDELRIAMLRDGAQDYVTKPFSPEELRARVDNLVSARRSAEALRASEERFSGIISMSADAIVSIDEDQRITLYNDAAERIFGWSRAEAIGASIDTLIPEQFRAHHREEVRQFAAGASAARRMGERSAEILGLRKGGDVFPCDAAISRVDVDGKRLLTVTLRDITERRRAEREQRFLADVGAALLPTALGFEGALTAVAGLVVRSLADCCIVDMLAMDGQPDRVAVLCRDPEKDAACARLREIDPQRPSFVAEVLETRRPVLLRDVSAERLESMAQSQEHLRALHEIGPRSSMVVPLLARGQLLGALAFISSSPSIRYDARDLAFAEDFAGRAAMALDNARLYETARRATQARDEVLGVVAHDLRNPLNAIQLHTRVLQHRMEKRGEEDGAASARAIFRSSQRANRLIQDLLDVARMESGVLTVDRGAVAAEKIVSEAVEAQRVLASDASLELTLDLAPGLPEVWADRDRLLQVFENLIGNAMKFTKPGGHITVGAAPREGEVEFRVSDTGDGIGAEEQAHVFDRFWQARKAGGLGAGLGLPIVKGIIEAHGGRIRVESTPGCGSTFLFTIPTTTPP